MSEETYSFGRAYKVKLLALCLQNRLFLQGYRDIIRPQWFDDKTLIDIAREILEYYDRFKTAPTFDSLEEALADFLRDNPERQERREDFISAFNEMKNVTLHESEDLISRAVQFARRQAIREAVKENIDSLRDENYTDMERRIREALQVGVSKTDLGVSYFEDETRFERMREKHTISTGLPELDILLNGGAAPGELVVIEAPTNGFKSGALINFGTAALWQGCDVVYLSMEITEPQIGRRFDGTLTGLVTARAGKESVRREIEKVRERIGANLWLKSWPLGDASSEDARSFLYTLKAEGKICTGERPLCLLVDYPQIWKPIRHYDSHRFEIRNNYQEALRLGIEFDCPVYAPMQTNQAAESKKLITKADLAECYAVAGDAHIILSLNQTKDEADANIMRVYVAKSRESQAFKYVEVTLNKELTLWRQPGASSNVGAVGGVNYAATAPATSGISERGYKLIGGM